MADGQARREGREGARWVNVRPSSEEVAEWFEQNVSLHEGLDAKDYVGGITLIQSIDKAKEVVGWRENGKPIIEETSNVVLTPYPRVDIRVKYWNDLMGIHAEDWLGVIEPVTPVEPNAQLPSGFFSMAVGDARFVCCSMKATVYKRETVEWVQREIRPESRHSRPEFEYVREGETLIDAPPATKMIPVLGRYGPDPFSLMKAETGAIGRALGLAGMLVVPGSGVATAEDLAEAQQLEAGGEVAAAAPEQAETPAASAPQDDEALRKQAAEMIEKLKPHAKPYKQFQEWCNQRGIAKLSDANGPSLKGVVKALEKALDEAPAAA